MLIFLSVTLAMAGLFRWLFPSIIQQRLQTVAGPTQETNWMEVVVQVVGPFAKLSPPTENWEDSPLRVRFITAGIRNKNAPILFFGAKTLLPFLFTVVTYLGLQVANERLELITLILVLIIVATVGCYLPNMVVNRIINARKRNIFENFPDAADLLLICVEAGLSLDAGLAKVTEEMKVKSVSLAEELHLTNLEMRAGVERGKALRNLALRTGVEEINIFASMLTQADKFGTSIGDSLRIFSDDLRYKRQVRAEEMAAKVPTKLLFPLVLFIFPAVMMVILGPALIQVVRVLGPMLSGQQ